MKNLKKTRVMLACAALALACAARGVETKCLDGLWEFAFAEGKSLAEAKPDFAATDRMPVPGCYDLVPGYYMKRGTGLYRREFTLARSVPGARVRVKGMGPTSSGRRTIRRATSSSRSATKSASSSGRSASAGRTTPPRCPTRSSSRFSSSRPT